MKQTPFQSSRFIVNLMIPHNVDRCQAFIWWKLTSILPSSVPLIVLEASPALWR